MKITWLGQAGFLLCADGVTVVIDPYLSDSCHKVNPLLYRRFPVDEQFLKLCPDVIVLTHNHLDHTDPETLDYYLKDKSGVTVLASENAWNKVREYKGGNNYVMFNAGTEFTVKGITFKAVYAEHSDSAAIGVVIEYNNKTYYFTGDTLYNKRVIEEAPKGAEAVFLPINGKGNNMNVYDAKRFVNKTSAAFAVPCHFSLFDDIDAKEEFNIENAVIPTPFEEIQF
ncbi:MAG: MBL fold metallo-hydrolase [Clostridia bacterium]|nr:MBL fold metallo-hydrolase [Clostridia bacterium]MEE1024455.1 MBL fold metallo-hydrolase [Acutalibacteraceae bacterium]